MAARRNILLIGMVVLVLGLSAVYPVRSYPTYELYEGELFFDGERALLDLEYLVTQFPQRHAGSPGNAAAAEYMAQRFKDIHLEVFSEEFVVRSMFNPQTLPSEVSPRSMINLGTTVGEVFQPVQGRNVVAILRGQSPDTIVLGAHRDTFNTVEGAEDNASGSVVLLQLAEILSQGTPWFTYVFVSFDAEEIGLLGSEHFCQNLKHHKIILAVSLDMLGWKEANAVGFYPFESAGKRTELWIYALAQQLSGRESLREGRTTSLLKDLWYKLVVAIPTDSDPFLKRGIPSLGVLAIDIEKPNYMTDKRPIHTTGDNIGIVSATSLQLTGQFMERYLKTVESGFIDQGHTSLYVPLPTGYVPPLFVGMFYALLPLLLGAILLADIIPILNSENGIGLALIKEAKWIALSLCGPLATVLWWYAAFSRLAHNLPILLVPLIGFAIPVTAIVILRMLRRRSKPETNKSILVRAVVLLILLIAGLALLGIARTTVMLAIPVLLGMYLPWVWLIAFPPLFLSLFMTYLPNVSNFSAVAFFAWSLCVWIMPGVFALSTRKPEKEV